jgi:ABC-2 type transport system ATP-binding protein
MTVQIGTAVPARTGGNAAFAIEAHDLVKTYPKGVRALDGLSFEVPAGTVFGLLGPNGAGKSTTIKILTTLAQADSGAALVAGLDVRAKASQVRSAIGVVAQRSGADPMAPGRENLLLSGRIQGLRGRDLTRRADDLLGRFGLADAAGRLVRTYSGGMQRRLDVAMGLINRPKVLFLDEPTAGLDPESRAAMWDEIRRLSGAEGLTILLTTHYLEEADRLAGRLAIVDSGRVVAAGTPDELKGELRGDAVHVELARPATHDQVNAALERVPGVHEIRVDGRRLSTRAEEGATAVPGVLAALDDAGLGAAAVTVARPSLDDVYLRHTGRRFADANEARPDAATSGRNGPVTQPSHPTRESQ